MLFGGLAYFNTLAVREAQDQVYRERIVLAQGIANDISQDFNYLASDLRLGAQSLDLSDSDFQSAAEEFYRSLKLHSESQFFRVCTVSILDEQGRLLATAPSTSTAQTILPNPQVIQSSLSKNVPDVLRSQSLSSVATHFATVVVAMESSFSDGRSFILVADTASIDGIHPIIPGGEAGYSMEIVAIDGGMVVAASDPEEVGNNSSHLSMLEPYMETGLGGVEIHASRHNHVTAMTPLPNGPFYVTLEQPADVALAVPHRLQNEMWMVSIIFIPFMLGAAWYTTRKVVRPLEQLRAATKAIAQGNLNEPIRVSAQDELGQLANDAETMRQQLKKSLDEIEQRKLELEQKVAERTKRLSETLGKVISAQEGERQRLARGVHDEQCQALGALIVMLDRVSRLTGTASSDVKTEIEQAREMARRLLEETRRLIYDLRPSVLDDMGLESAIRWCVEKHLEAKGIAVIIKSSLSSARLPNMIEVSLFRVAQEAIVNIERHSHARHAGILMEKQDSILHMRVWDDGEGFTPYDKEIDQMSGLGLQGMQERIRLIGGRVEIISTPKKGTTIEVKVPLGQGGEARGTNHLG